MAAPYVKNMLNLTKMQFTESCKKPCHVRKGFSFSSARRMEAEEQGGNHTLTQATPGNVQPPSSLCWGSTAPTCPLPPGAASVLAQCGVSGLHSKNCPAEGWAVHGKHGTLQLAKRECAVTGLAKLQGTLEAFNC